MSKKYSDQEIEIILAENNFLKQKDDVVNDFLIITKTDKFGIITYANKSFLEISGYSESELIGKNHNIVRHPDISKLFFKTLWNKINIEKEIWQGVVKNISKNGKTYYVESLISPIFDKDKNIIEYISIRKDITKRIERESALNSEKKFVKDVLNYQDSIILLTNESQGMLDVNRKFFEYVEFENIKDFRNHFRCIGDLFIPEEKMVFNCSIDWIEDIFHNKEKSHKAKLVGKDNKIHYFSIRVEKIEASESRIKRYKLKNDNLYILTLNDVTDLELALQKAKAGIEAKSRFLANMSHEIRTPMNGIIGFTELIKNTKLDIEQKKFINTIINSSKTLLGIINDILDFSKVESGNMSLEYMKFNPIHELEPTLNIFNTKMIDKKIEYLLFIDPNLPKWIILDPLRLKQVISNLISNALKFTPKNGIIQINITSKRLDSENIELFISVEDNGIGIEKDKQANIFKPFNQADNSITRKFGGTGLGLSISKSFIELMHGKLNIDSEYNKGSIFSFSIKAKASVEIGLETKWIKDKIVSIYISNSNFINLKVKLLEKYIKAFGVNANITSNINELKDSETIWVISSSLEIYDIENIKSILGDREIVIIEDYDNSLNEKLMMKNAHRFSFPFCISSVYEMLIQTLGKKRDFTKEVLQKSEENNESQFKNTSVLVVEDNEVNQMFIEILLKGYGINPDLAENGQICVDKLIEKDYDLILMDINMPILGGVEATQKIRKLNSKKSETNIVALTANAMIGDREKFLSEGMNDYLTKPIDIQELKRVLAKFLLNQSEIEKESRIIDNLNGDKSMIKIPEDTFEPISKEIISTELGLPAQFVDMLINKFLETIDSNLSDLEKAILDKNASDVKNFAHKIKGSAGNLRFKYLAEIMKDIESSGKDEVLSGYEDLIEKSKIEISKIKEFANG